MIDPAMLVEELVGRGLVSLAEVAEVAGHEDHKGKSVDRALIEEGLVSEGTVLDLMSELYEIPRLELTPDLLDSTLAEELPRRLLENFCVYPLLREPGSEVLRLATTDPLDVTVVDTFRQVTGRDVAFVLTEKARIEQAIRGEFLNEEGLRLLVDDLPEVPEWERFGSDLEAGELTEHAAPIIRLVNSICREAVRQRASDIHIEPQEKCFRVRYRIDGLLQTVVELPKRAERTCVSRIKIMAGMDISSSRGCQDGRIVLRLGSVRLNLRVSAIAACHGEKVVIRVLDQASDLTLTDLGLSRDDLRTMTGHFQSSHGMILITGPTGSGKTSTLYAALRLLNSPTVNIVTVEDPIEYQLDGLTQVQTNPKAGVTFASALRTFLRQDPDVILVGEIRDVETAGTAIAAAQTGHLVLSTLHTNDAPGALSRLVMMGIEAHMISGSLLCVVAQRLVRRLCPCCREPVKLSEVQARVLSVAVDGRVPTRLFQSRGCPDCGGKGYRGRLGLYEILTVDSAIRQQVVRDPSEDGLWNVARESGMRTLLEDGLRKVERGLTSLDEVLRVVTVRRRPATSGAENPSRAAESCLPRLVEQAMTRKVLTFLPDTSLQTVAQSLLAAKITGAPVVDQKGTLLGVISYSDVALGGPHERGELQAQDAMSPHVVTVHPQDSLITAAQKMWVHKVHRVVVTEGKGVVGILTPFDLMDRHERADMN